MIVIQTDFGQPLADGFRLPFHLHRRFSEAASLLIADRQIAAHLLDGLEQAVELFAIGFCTMSDFTDLAFHPRCQSRDVLQMLAGVFDLLDTDLQITRQLANLLHHLRRPLLNVGDHLTHFTGGRRRARR
ncbi:hypothetical protein D3C81_1801120 [compost metagenome]